MSKKNSRMTLFDIVTSDRRNLTVSLSLGFTLVVSIALVSNPGFFPFVRDVLGPESSTPWPTYTPLPTYTVPPAAIPSNTPILTITPTATLTPTATPTDTPIPTSTITPTQTPIPPRIIIDYIQPNGQLVVIKYEYARADIHIAVEDGRWCSHDADYVAQGAIEAGIDLGSLDEDSVSYDWATDSYTLHLPAPGLTSCRIEYIRQYANSLSICNPDWDQVRILAHREAINSFVDKALEEGLLERAADQAEVLLGAFVTSFTGKPVNVLFDTMAATSNRQSSCQPEIPNGWEFDSETRKWTKKN